MFIDIESGTVRAWKTGVESYVPVFDGRPLEEETGSPEPSRRNLQVILQKTELASLVPGTSGVLVVFCTGETYLATGFSITDDLRCKALAKFAAKSKNADANALYSVYRSLPADWSQNLLSLSDSSLSLVHRF